MRGVLRGTSISVLAREPGEAKPFNGDGRAMLREAEPFTPFVRAVNEVDDHFGSVLELVAAHSKAVDSIKCQIYRHDPIMPLRVLFFGMQFCQLSRTTIR